MRPADKEPYDASLLSAPKHIHVHLIHVHVKPPSHWKRVAHATVHVVKHPTLRHEIIAVLRDCWFNLVYDLLKWGAFSVAIYLFINWRF